MNDKDRTKAKDIMEDLKSLDKRLEENRKYLNTIHKKTKDYFMKK